MNAFNTTSKKTQEKFSSDKLAQSTYHNKVLPEGKGAKKGKSPTQANGPFHYMHGIGPTILERKPHDGQLEPMGK